MQAFIKYIRQQPWLIAYLLVMAAFIFLRLWRLSLPAETVFDEVYFPKMAHQYLTGEKFFDIHPPLGKLIIAIGEMAFGNTTLGWRIMPALAGIAMLPVAYWATVQIFHDKRAGLLAALLIAIDGLFIVYSRTGLMDGFLILFGLLSVGFCWQFRNRRLAGQTAWGSLLATGFFAGLALAVKWIGAGFLPVVAAATMLTLWQKPPKATVARYDWLVWVTSFVVLPFALYTIPFLANWQQNFWEEFIRWHQQSWGYNINLNATHPYASKWWSWPFLLRPIWFYYKGEEGMVAGVDAIGNPLLWWGSTLAVVYSLLILAHSAYCWLRNRAKEILVDSKTALAILFLVGGWAAFYLPWTMVGRVLFLYHYFGSYLFALLLTAFWLSRAWEGQRSRKVALFGLMVVVLVGLLFAPIWIAYPIPQDWFDQLMWFKSWI